VDGKPCGIACFVFSSFDRFSKPKDPFNTDGPTDTGNPFNNGGSSKPDGDSVTTEKDKKPEKKPEKKPIEWKIEVHVSDKIQIVGG
ncbi:hypothetical protein Q0N68_14065, partial [Staphylococcus aureus]|nr:hypothetical protein [Staphylococcus aureus]